MKRMKFILLILTLFTFGSVNAQQLAMYSQYMFNTLLLNPAYAGNREILSATALARAQWVGFEGAPVSQTFTIDGAVKSKNVGWGATVYNDKIGLTATTGGYGSYAYRIRMKKATLAMGLQLGIVQYRNNGSSATVTEGSTAYDPTFNTDFNAWIPSLGAGFYLSNDKYYVGLSAPTFINTQLSNNVKIEVQRYDHLFAMAGYVFKLSDDFKLKPSTLIKAVKGSPITMDLNVNLWMRDMIGLGVSYRPGDAIVGIFELQISRTMRVGYSYDYTITDLKKYNSGSHELLLRYEFGYGKDKVYTPRYF
jgi:type IX secretion system PorP/SprF family membrane protein